MADDQHFLVAWPPHQPLANSLHCDTGIKFAVDNPLQPLKSVLQSLTQDQCMRDCLVLDSVKFNVFFIS